MNEGGVRNLKAEERLILALDVGSVSEAISLIDILRDKLSIVKVNSLAAIFPQIVSEIKKREMKVWRDWKYYDTASVVSEFIRADIKAGIYMTTVHILGGPEMMESAVKAASDTDLKILGITILNPRNIDRTIGIPGRIRTKIIELALSAEKVGLSGVVASAQEARDLRRFLKPETLIVVPDVKPAWAVPSREQAKVTTPSEAIEAGADYIVVGSPIYKSRTPALAVDRIIAEIEKSLEERNLEKDLNSEMV